MELTSFSRIIRSVSCARNTIERSLRSRHPTRFRGGADSISTSYPSASSPVRSPSFSIFLMRCFNVVTALLALISGPKMTTSSSQIRSYRQFLYFTTVDVGGSRVPPLPPSDVQPSSSIAHNHTAFRTRHRPWPHILVPQIATFTGHSLKDVEAILDAHYLGRDIQLAEAAVLKLEARTKL